MRAITLVAVLLGGLSLTTNAVVITFEEIPPANGNFDFLSEEYATLGIHFITTDDGSIFGGLSVGDPGNWDLEGTNRPAFLGFNGSGYLLTANIERIVTSLEIVWEVLYVRYSAGVFPAEMNYKSAV